MCVLNTVFSGRALTLRSPWPFGVHLLDKRCENRDQPPPDWLVGPEAPWVALHTGAHRATTAEIVMLRRTAFEAGWEPHLEAGAVRFEKDGRSEVAGSASMLSLIPGVFRILSVDRPYEGDLTGWRRPESWAYRIDYRALPSPIPCAGPTPKPGKTKSTNLGWWRVPVDVAERIVGVLHG